MGQQIAGMDPERLGPKIDFNVNYRHALLSERAPQFRNKKFSDQKKKKKKLVNASKGGPNNSDCPIARWP
jgi:hypothetical protein